MDKYHVSKNLLRTYVKGTYDLQALRIATGNRICTNFAARLGLDLTKKGRPAKGAKKAEPDPDLEVQPDAEVEAAVEADLGKAEAVMADPEEFDKDKVKELFDKLKASYKRLTDGIIGLPREKNFKGDEVISEYAELVLIRTYLTLEENEVASFNALHGVLMKYFPIYSQWLHPEVYGCGQAMGAVLCSEIDIYIAATAAKIWKFAGVDVADDGAGRSRRPEHLVERPYMDKNGAEKTRMGITFSPVLKTKLIGVLGSLFVKQSPDKSKYRRMYDIKKEYYRTHTYWGEHNDKAHRADKKLPHWKKASKMHRHNMAIRYACKIFLLDLYLKWRALEGLPIAPKPDWSKKQTPETVNA